MTRALGLVVVLLGLALFSAIRPVWSLDPDAAAYMSLGRSIAAGDGYVLDGLPHAKYPPGLPLLLAASIRVAGVEAYASMHALLVTLLLASVLLSERLARRLGATPPVALAVAAATGLSQTFFQLSVEYLRSEVPFLVLSLGALLALLAACARAGRARHVLVGGLLLAGAMLTRLAGVGLLAVPAAVLVCPRATRGARLRSLLLLVVGLAVLGGWMGRGRAIASAHPEAPDYSSELLAAEPRDLTKHVRLDMPSLDAAGFARRVAGNAKVLARACATLLTNVDKAAERLPVGLVLLALLVVGLIVGLRDRPTARPPPDGSSASDGAALAAPHEATRDATRDPGAATDPVVVARRLSVLYVVATLGLYLIWPFDQQERFYAPLLPLLLVFAGLGALWLHGVAGTTIRGGGLARGLLALAALATLAWLASQRSNDPTVLGRWSKAYAALLGLAGLGVLALLLASARRRWPALHPGAAWLLPLVFAVPWAHQRFVRWPRLVADFEARRAARPVEGPLARIDLYPVLETVALHLRDATPADSVLMTDVPKMLALVGERRCIPFTYAVDPPRVECGAATLVFHTASQPDAAAALAAVSADWPVALRIPLDPADPDGASVRILRVPQP